MQGSFPQEFARTFFWNDVYYRYRAIKSAIIPHNNHAPKADVYREHYSENSVSAANNGKQEDWRHKYIICGSLSSWQVWQRSTLLFSPLMLSLTSDWWDCGLSLWVMPPLSRAWKKDPALKTRRAFFHAQESSQIIRSTVVFFEYQWINKCTTRKSSIHQKYRCDERQICIISAEMVYISYNILMQL